jgi:alpha-beta hydrolase superfamily lysophospholipase
MGYNETAVTTADGLALFVRIWTPEAAPRGVVLIVHGLGEHAGRYPHLVRALTDHGYVVFGHDQRGCGRSEGRRGDFRTFAEVLDDLDRVVSTARTHYPGLPLVLYAHSLGAMYATHYLARRNNGITAAVLSAPGYGPGPDLSAMAIRLAGWLARIAPGLYLRSRASEDFRLSHDPEAKRAYDEDPLRIERFTTRFAATNLQKAAEAQGLLARLHLPILVILPADDTTINRQAVLTAVAQAGPNVTFRTYPGWHELHNELPELREPVLNDVLEWLEGVIGNW